LPWPCIGTPYVLPRTISRSCGWGRPSPCDGRKSEDVTGSRDPAEVNCAIGQIGASVKPKKPESETPGPEIYDTPPLAILTVLEILPPPWLGSSLTFPVAWLWLTARFQGPKAAPVCESSLSAD